MSKQIGFVRTVRTLVQPQMVLEGAGVRLRRSFPTRALDYPDPFLLLDHFGSDDPEDYLAGFPRHPHRGIETVTYLLAGAVTHRDSIGNAGTITAGDVQWMTAGGGILHEEMPQPVDGKMEGFQLWVNLPARLKMTHPHYQEISSNQIPTIHRKDNSTIRVIAGEMDGVVGPVIGVAADPLYLDIDLPANNSYSFPVKPGHAVLVYIYRGQVSLGEGEVSGTAVANAPGLAVLEDGDLVSVQTEENAARMLLFSGLPLHDPIVRYGPFVMNTRQEIEQALQDLHDGTFVRE